MVFQAFWGTWASLKECFFSLMCFYNRALLVTLGIEEAGENELPDAGGGGN